MLSLSHEEVQSRLLAAYRRGCNSHFDPDTWQPEDLWERSLADIRAAFEIEGT
jgi:ubiquinone biosynthesis protein COQ4